MAQELKIAKVKGATNNLETTNPCIKVKSLKELKSLVKPSSLHPNEVKQVISKKPTVVGSTTVKLMKSNEKKTIDPSIKKDKTNGNSSSSISTDINFHISHGYFPLPPDLPTIVIDYINKLEMENKDLKKKLAEFRKESTNLAHQLLNLSKDPESIFLKQKRPLKRKIYPSGLKEVKRIDKSICFPLNSVQTLSSVEFGLSNPDFYESKFQELYIAIDTHKITEKNLLHIVLSSLINLEVLASMNYEEVTGTVSLKTFVQFRDLFCRLVNSFSNVRLKKLVDSKEIETFLKCQIEEQKRIKMLRNLTQKNEKPIEIIDIKVEKDFFDENNDEF